MANAPRHDQSSALGSDSSWDREATTDQSSSNPRPIDPKRMPIVVYLASDFRPGPMDNGQISLKATLLSAAWADMSVVRWTVGASMLDGIAEKLDPRHPEIAPQIVDIESIRNWAGGVTLVASWPGNEEVVRALEIVLTGPYGEPKVIRDGGNANIHMHEHYAGYGSGLDYAARKRP